MQTIVDQLPHEVRWPNPQANRMENMEKGQVPMFLVRTFGRHRRLMTILPCFPPFHAWKARNNCVLCFKGPANFSLIEKNEICLIYSRA
jgi:hypothetical protein